MFVFLGLRHFVRRCCALFSHEFHMNLQDFSIPELFFSTRVFVFLVSETAPCLFSDEFTRFCKTRVVFSMRVFVFLV